ncbi:restriction endonuclease subunit S [Shewanella chilikensis]|uniref:restriction endonuclease subunit S n=1 Tax=Shewanella chilikensis TaxID=558541 RepID=UPI0030D07E5A
MSEWKLDRLADLATFQKGRKVDTSPFPLIGYEKYLGAGALSGKTDGYASTFFAVRAAEHDVLMLWDGERSGLCGTGLSGVVSSTVSKLSPNGKIDSNLLYYLLLQNFEWIQHRRTGTGVPHVPKDIGRILCIRYPERKSEQQKIAHILQTIDQTIEKTQVLIEKYQQIKAGLMHDLFTRGIAPNGQLRPPREQAPELYQQTPIGWIPKEWEHMQLESLLAQVPNNLRSGPFGSALLKAELVEDGIPFLGIDNIHTEKFVDHFRRFVSEEKFLELNKYAVRPRDVIITIMGTVGRASVVPEHVDSALSSKHLWTMTFDQEKVISELICWQLNYAPWVKSWFRRETQGGIMDAIQSRTLKTLTLPLPPYEEQLRIFGRYNSLTAKMKSEELLFDNLKKQKTGLMEDLLTGKVPVKVEPEAQLEAEISA